MATLAPRAKRVSEVSCLFKAIFEATAAEDLHMAIANLPCSLFMDPWKGVQWDQDDVTFLRSCLMKPEHLDWIGHIWQAFDLTTNRVLNR